MKGIRLRWTYQPDEKMEAYLTFDQAREHFGLGGTPDNLMRRRIGQVATQREIVAAAEKFGDPRLVDRSTPRIVLLEYVETDEVPGPEPEVCCTCKQPIPRPKDT